MMTYNLHDKENGHARRGAVVMHDKENGHARRGSIILHDNENGYARRGGGSLCMMKPLQSIVMLAGLLQKPKLK